MIPDESDVIARNQVIRPKTTIRAAYNIMTSLLIKGVARAAKMIVRTRFPYLRLTLSPWTPITTPCPIRLDQFSGLRSPSIVGISSDTVGWMCIARWITV